MSLALGNGPTYENGDDPGPFYLGAFSVNAAHGWRPADGRLPAFRLGIGGPADGGATADAYVQLPPAWLGPVAAGVGVLVGVTKGRRMPYAQAGVQDARGRGVHLMTGYYDGPRDQRIGYWREERGHVSWLSAQLPVREWATVHAQVGYARGHVTRQGNNSPTPDLDEDRWVRLGGITLELHRPRRRLLPRLR